MKKASLILAIVSVCLAQVSAPTAHYDNTRIGYNSNETILNRSNVSRIKKLWGVSFDGPLWVQPLFIPQANSGSANQDLLIVATSNNSLYAVNAQTGAAVWNVNFGATWNTPFAPLYGTPIGILGTPAADLTTGFVFAITVDPSAIPTLHKVSIATGVESKSVAISGSYPGTGCGSDHTSGGNVQFWAPWENNHTPLTIANGNVYFGFSAGNEPFQWHGWVFSYAESDLSQQAVLLLSPNGCGAGVWMPGIAADATGLYFMTGNGDWDGTSNFSQSAIRTNASLVIQDWFTPSNHASTSAADADMSSGKVMLIPGTNFLTFASKDGRAWILDKTNLGHLQGTGAAPQVINVATVTAGPGTGTYGGWFANSTAYFPIAGQPTFALSFAAGAFTPLASTVANFAQVTGVGTSNNGADAIVWILTEDSSPFSSQQPVTLRAMNGATMVELWNSGTIGNASKFAAPVVANGMVFAPTFNAGLQAFGLQASSSLTGQASITGQVVIK